MWKAIKGFFKRLFGFVEENEVAQFALETAAVTAGHLVAKNNPDLAKPFNRYYNMFLSGQLTASLLNKGIQKLEEEELSPLVINRLVALGRMIGAEIDGRRVLDISQVDEKLLRIAVKGFTDGMSLPTK